MASCACCSSALCVATRVARTPSDERRHDAKDRESGHLNTDALARDLVGGELQPMHARVDARDRIARPLPDAAALLGAQHLAVAGLATGMPR
jgi:hypothetical protein